MTKEHKAKNIIKITVRETHVYETDENNTYLLLQAYKQGKLNTVANNIGVEKCELECIEITFPFDEISIKRILNKE